MKITFNINYHTSWGEALYICGDHPALGAGDPHKACEMSLTSPDMWQFSLEVEDNPGDFNYWFIVKAPEREWRFEWGKAHRFVSGEGIDLCTIFDSWHNMPSDKHFYSSAFVDGMIRRPKRDQQLPSLPGSLNIRIEAPMIAPDECLAICGEGEALGNWDPALAVRMNDANFPEWEINIPLSHGRPTCEYKFVVL